MRDPNAHIAKCQKELRLVQSVAAYYERPNDSPLGNSIYHALNFFIFCLACQGATEGSEQNQISILCKMAQLSLISMMCILARKMYYIWHEQSPLQLLMLLSDIHTLGISIPEGILTVSKSAQQSSPVMICTVIHRMGSQPFFRDQMPLSDKDRAAYKIIPDGVKLGCEYRIAHHLLSAHAPSLISQLQDKLQSTSTVEGKTAQADYASINMAYRQ